MALVHSPETLPMADVFGEWLDRDVLQKSFLGYLQCDPLFCLEAKFL